MEPIVAKCGYRCDLCRAFETHLKSEEDKREIAAAFKRYYDAEIPLEDIKPCKGCPSAEQPPDDDCSIFPCVQQRGINNCAYCEDFGCGKLKSRMDAVEEILAKQHSIPDSDYQDFFMPYLSRDTLLQIRQTAGIE